MLADMTNHNERAGGAGRPVLWAVLALSLLVWLTFGLAIPNNPLY